MISTSLLLLITAFLYSVWFFFFLNRRTSRPEALLAAFLSTAGQILVTELILGQAGLLTAWWVSGANLLWSALLLYSCRETVLETRVSSIGSQCYSELKSLWFSDARLLFGLQAAVALWTIFLGAIFPPYGWDALAYRLPMAATFLQDATLHIQGNVLVEAYPLNAELLFAWNLLLAGSDVVVDLTQLLFLVAGTIALIVTCHRLGFSASSSKWAACVFFFAPTALIQAKTNYNDLMVAAVFFLGVYFLLSGRDRSPLWLAAAMGGSAAGIILGAKYNGAAYVLALFVLLLYRIYAEQQWSDAEEPSAAAAGWADRWRWRKLGLFAGMTLLLGGYTYLRNLILFGNPLFPWEIQLFGHTVFAGVSDLEANYLRELPETIVHRSYLSRIWVSWRETMPYYSYDSRLSGLGPVWFILGLPAALSYVAWGLWTRKALPVLILAVHLLIFAVTPANWWPRYTLFMLELGAIGLAFMLDFYGARTTRVFKTLLFSLSLMAFITSIDHGLFSIERISRYAGLPVSERTLTHFGQDDYVGPAFAWIEQNVAAGSVIVCGTNLEGSILFSYPLWGTHLERKVYFFDTLDGARWVRKVKAVRADILFLRAGAREDKWAAESGGRLVFEDRGYRIYQLK